MTPEEKARAREEREKRKPKRKVVGRRRREEEEAEEEREPLSDDEREMLETSLTGIFQVMGSGIYELATMAPDATKISFSKHHAKTLARSWLPLAEKYIGEGALMWAFALGGTAFVGSAMAVEIRESRKGVKRPGAVPSPEPDEGESDFDERFRRARMVR